MYTLDYCCCRCYYYYCYYYYYFIIIIIIIVIIGQHSVKFGGNKYLDIRQHFKSDNGEKIIPTKVGIRIPIDYLDPLESVCRRGVTVSSQLLRESSDTLNLVRVTMMEKDLKTILDLKNSCRGCGVDDPQIDHDQNCMAFKRWNDVVDKYFEDAYVGMLKSFY